MYCIQNSGGALAPKAPPGVYGHEICACSCGDLVPRMCMEGVLTPMSLGRLALVATVSSRAEFVTDSC